MDTTDGPFLVTARGAPGLTPDQVRGPRFVAPSRGVRFPADVPVVLDAVVDSAILTRPEVSVLCDVSAAQHWTLPLPPRIAFEIESRPVGVAVARGGSRQRRAGVRGRRLELPVEHLVIDRQRTLTCPARTWLDCAALIPLEDLVAMGDVILCRRLATVSELEEMIRWASGRRGVRSARQALPILDRDAQSPGESRARCLLVTRKVPRPECNADLIIDGEWLARPDMMWRRERVIVEYDGAVHLPEEQRRKDALRRNLIQDAGWTVIVFTAADLRNPDRMAALVTSALGRFTRSHR